MIQETDESKIKDGNDLFIPFQVMFLSGGVSELFDDLEVAFL